MSSKKGFTTFMKTERGFTLIELLVGLAILAVLGGVGLTSFRDVQSKARDNERKQDLRALASALELYYQKNDKYIDNSPGINDGCQGNDTNYFYNPTTGIAPFMANNKVPTDPKTGANYCYLSINDGTSFRLFAKLEKCTSADSTLCNHVNYNFSIVSQDLQIASAPGDFIPSGQITFTCTTNCNPICDLTPPHPPYAPFGVCTLDGTFRNDVVPPTAYSNLYFSVTQCTNCLVLNTDTPPPAGGGAGSILTLPSSSFGADGILAPGESFTQIFQFGLQGPGSYLPNLYLYGNPIPGYTPPPTSTPTPSPTPTPLAYKRVFLSSQIYTGNLGGLAGADSKCQTLANTQPSLAGSTWKAWLSDAIISAASRLTHSSIPYKSVTGSITFANDWADLTDNSIIAPIDRIETGAAYSNSVFVWTNTRPNGTIMGTDPTGVCDNWSTLGFAANADGRVDRIDSGWTLNGVGTFCNVQYHLYCFEQ